MKYSIQDIVKNELCTGCGLCVSESEDAKMVWNEYGFLVPDISTEFNERAIKLCPFNPAPDQEVEDEDRLADIFLTSATRKDQCMGSYINIYVGYSKEYRETSSSGGIATYIFEQLLIQGIVNHLFIVKEVNGSCAYQWFDEAKKIKEISKTRYYPVTLEKLFKEIDNKDGEVAVSGVACFLKGIRLKQHYYPQYKKKIPFLIGIICGGLKSSFFSDYLAQKSGIDGTYSKQQYRIKDYKSTASDYSFGAYDNEKVFHQLKMRTVGDMWGSGLFKDNACDFCDDVTTELADISLGDAWIQPYNKDGRGTSVIVSRTALADKLILDGISNKELNVQELNQESFLASQQGNLRHRQLAQAYRIKQKRRQIIPQKREKFNQSIPFEFKLVQKSRMIVRQQSLEVWREEKDAKKFEARVFPLRDKLNKKTIIYHYVQTIRGKLGMKRL